MKVIFVIELGDPCLPDHAHGSVEQPRCWICYLRIVGTTTNIFHDFCDYFCGDIETNNIPGINFHWIFILGNLMAHHSAYVHSTVMNHDCPSQFSIIP
jgi:hypothetical protein